MVNAAMEGTQEAAIVRCIDRTDEGAPPPAASLQYCTQFFATPTVLYPIACELALPPSFEAVPVEVEEEVLFRGGASGS